MVEVRDGFRGVPFLGPCVSEGERIIVEALMIRYLGRADYRESIFAGSIKE
jgi:hypothetical protein